jgi:hypothetical protein
MAEMLALGASQNPACNAEKVKTFESELTSSNCCRGLPCGFAYTGTNSFIPCAPEMIRKSPRMAPSSNK